MEGFPSSSDPTVKKFLQDHPQVLSDPQWHMFFSNADVSRALESIDMLRKHFEAVAPHTAAAGVAIAEDRKPRRSIEELLTQSNTLFDAVLASSTCLANLQKMTKSWSIPADLPIDTQVAELVTLFKAEVERGKGAVNALSTADQVPFLHRAVTESHKLLESLIKFMVHLVIPSSRGALRRFVDTARWFTKTLKAEIAAHNADAFAINGLMRVKHDRYIKDTNKYTTPGVVDIDVHVSLFEKLGALLTKYATDGVPPTVVAAAANAIKPPTEYAHDGETREFGAGRFGTGRAHHAGAPAPEAGVLQFSGKEGTVTRWTPQQHWGLITYDGVSTAFMPEGQIPADQVARIGVDAVVRFDGFATARSQREGKLEARNVSVVRASPHPGAGAQPGRPPHDPAAAGGFHRERGERPDHRGEHRTGEHREHREPREPREHREYRGGEHRGGRGGFGERRGGFGRGGRDGRDERA